MGVDFGKVYRVVIEHYRYVIGGVKRRHEDGYPMEGIDVVPPRRTLQD